MHDFPENLDFPAQPFGKVDFHTFIKKSTSIPGVEENAWNRIIVMTEGSFQVVISSYTATCVSHVEVYVFPEMLIFIVSVRTSDSCPVDVYVGPSFS